MRQPQGFITAWCAGRKENSRAIRRIKPANIIKRLSRSGGVRLYSGGAGKCCFDMKSVPLIRVRLRKNSCKKPYCCDKIAVLKRGLYGAIQI